MIIAFMGNDGSGKTTVIKLLQAKLAEIGKDTIYVPGFNHCFIGRVKQWFGGAAGIDINEWQKEYENPKRGKAKLFFYLWPYLVFLDCLCLFIKYFFRFDKVVIFDRYFYDYPVSFRNLKINSWLEEQLFLMLPKPKYCYLFDVSPYLAYERKKTTHLGRLDYYEEQRARYLWLAGRKKIAVVTTDSFTPEELVQKILNQIVKNEKIFIK